MRNKNLMFGAIFVLVVFASLLVFQGASAQEPPQTGFENICGRGIGLAKCVQQIYVLALGLGAIVALLMIVLAGYRYMTAQGNAQQVENAKEALTSAFIGLIVIFVAFILLYLINPDLVNFKGLSFPVTKQSAPPPRGGGASSSFAVAGQEVTAGADLVRSSISADGTITSLLDNGRQLVLTPTLTSSLPYSFSQTLSLYGLDPSALNIVEYEVNDPSLIPDSMAKLMNGARPTRILVVTGSFFMFDADAMHADTSGNTLLAAVHFVGLYHFGVNLSINSPPGAGGSCGTTCRLCDNNPAQCSSTPGCISATTSSGGSVCLAQSGGSTAPPSGSCPAGTSWSGHMDGSGQPICLGFSGGTGGGGGCATPPSGSCPAGQCWVGHFDSSQQPICQSASTPGGGGGGHTCPATGFFAGSCPTGLCWSGYYNASSQPICSIDGSLPPGSTLGCPPGTTLSGYGEPGHVPYCFPFEQCTLHQYCEDPATGEPIPGTEGTPNGCEGIGNQRIECYYPSQSAASIACDRTFRRERESCLAQIDNATLPDCEGAQPGQACRTADNGRHCRYSNQQEAFYCGALWSNLREGYCNRPGQTNCYPQPACRTCSSNPSACTTGEKAACGL